MILQGKFPKTSNCKTEHSIQEKSWIPSPICSDFMLYGFKKQKKEGEILAFEQMRVMKLLFI
jgi:hypothetical protein